MMVAAVSGAASTPKAQCLRDDARQQNPRRPPLLASERDNNGANTERPKSRQVSSRYMLSPSISSSSSSHSSASSISSSFSTPRRYPSPQVSRNWTPDPKIRAVSVDRRRPSPSRPDLEPKSSGGGDVSAASKQLFTATRSLSVSFQGEAFSLPISKTKAALAPPVILRRGTPERRRSSTSKPANLKRNEQHWWPARIKQANPTPDSPNPLLSSFDSRTEDQKKLSVTGSVGDDKLGLDIEISHLSKSIQHYPHYPDEILNESSFLSDSDTVSSGSSTSGRSSDIAKFCRETIARTPLLRAPSKMVVPPKFGQPKKFPVESPTPSPRIMSSPLRGSNIRPSSPSRLQASNDILPSRGMPSPSKVRSLITRSSSEVPSVLSFAVDVKRGKVGENQIVDAHQLRLLYNRYLQWQFVNARKEAVLSTQGRSVEKMLWNAWITISDIRNSVTKKTHLLHLLRQKLKLASILKEQMAYLEDWASLDKQHCTSLLGSFEALKGSTLRLPVVGGAISDLQSIKDAMGSAVDVMQAMASSICSLSLKVEEMSSTVAELTKEIAKEQALLEQSKGFLTTMAALQAKDCSSRTHILQLSRVPIG